jgi:HEAT repeat protein
MIDERPQRPVLLLSDKASARRRAAAKQLRKLKDPSGCPALLRALEQEIGDRRTWETQYHMVMALAETGCESALPLLHSLISKDLEPMTLTAVGDALVRLGRKFSDDPSPLLELLSSGVLPLAEGGIRAVAMLRLKLPIDAVRRTVAFASHERNSQVRFWVAAASAGWDGPEVVAFLRSCEKDDLAETRRAAAAALKKQYLKWSPL